jgi:acetylornithine deacetylase/succinyl-diaminopimelate desuccinylase-like protein
MATVLKNIEAYRFPVRVNDATRRYLEASARVTPGEVGEAMARLAKDPTDSAAAEVLWHEPEQVGITRTTCVATMLRAGHAENALPQSATATVNCRIFPGTEVADVQAVLQRVGGNPDLDIRPLGDPVPSPAPPLRDDVMDAVRLGVERIRPGTAVIPLMSAYGTDGKAVRRAGIPTYGVMGIFIKDSDQFAHGLNERTTVRSFYDALEFWHVVLTTLSGRATS